jgi:hypothetical protein
MPLVNLPGGQLRDEIRNPLYDAVDLQGGISPIGIYRFFSSTALPGGQLKGLEQTNLRQPNSLPAATSFRCQGYSLDAQNFYAANKNVLPLIMEQSFVSVQVGDKVYAELPATLLAGRQSAALAVGRSSGTGEAAGVVVEDVYQSYGQPAVASVVLTGLHVIDIIPTQQFFATMTIQNMTAAEVALATPANGTKTRIYFALKGLLRRGVQ